MVDPDPKNPYYLPDRDPKYGSGSRSEPKSLSLSKDKYRREGKGRGRRCCLGDRIDSIPCRTSYFTFK